MFSATGHTYRCVPWALRGVLERPAGRARQAETAAHVGVYCLQQRVIAARWRGHVDALKEFGAGLRRMEQYHGIPPYGETVAHVIRIIRDLEVEEPDERRCRAATVRPTAGRL
jgi:hypothetical protein